MYNFFKHIETWIGLCEKYVATPQKFTNTQTPHTHSNFFKAQQNQQQPSKQ